MCSPKKTEHNVAHLSFLQSWLHRSLCNFYHGTDYYELILHCLSCTCSAGCGKDQHAAALVQLVCFFFFFLRAKAKDKVSSCEQFQNKVTVEYNPQNTITCVFESTTVPQSALYIKGQCRVRTAACWGRWDEPRKHQILLTP